ncbi:MAG: hypothetical protein K6E40_11015 [Desulfovibrio sp.]|nr:hypothetical protein [Desulfovibrio sp.]
MATMYRAFLDAEDGVFLDEEQSEVYDYAHFECLLRYADRDGCRFTMDCDNNLVEAVPKDGYDPAEVLSDEEYGLDEDVLKQIESGEIDECELAEIEQEFGLWDDEEKFDLVTIASFLGSAYDYLLAKAKETFSMGDSVSVYDIKGLVGEDNVDVFLEQEEYEKIAMLSTGNRLADE